MIFKWLNTDCCMCEHLPTLIERDKDGAAMPSDDHHTHDHSHGSELSDMQVRVRSLETVLSEKGYIDPAALDAIVEAYETRIGPHNGARVVARAWSDPPRSR